MPVLFAVLGLNHRTAPLEVREKLSFPDHSLRETISTLHAYEGVESCVIVSTCNRTEIYAVLQEERGVDSLWQFLSGYCGYSAVEMRPYTYLLTSEDALGHLFRVASGLDSMVLGETQILGQVKQAYLAGLEVDTVSSLMNVVFQHALALGKRVRHETGIDKNPVSISYAAVELARQTLGSLEGRSVLIVGAGKMSELTVKHLLANGVSGVMVSNRSYDRAVELAQQFGGRAVRFDLLYESMLDADIVISCTAASHYVIRAEQMVSVLVDRGHSNMFMIDIAVPRDIDPAVGHLEGVALYDIDSLQSVVDSNLAVRKRAAALAEEIIKQRLDEFTCALGTKFVVPTVAALKKRGDEIKERELQRAINRLGELSEREIKVIGSLANSIVNQLLHEPITRLKDYAQTPEGYHFAEALQKLFDLDTGDNKKSEKRPAVYRRKSGR